MAPLTDQRVFISGATGFIGGHLTDRLIRMGNSVVALVRPATDATALERLGVSVVRGDLADAAAVQRAIDGCEVVFSCAVFRGRKPDRFKSNHQTNVIGVENIMRSSRNCGVRRVIHCSTCAVHGRLHGGPVNEEAPLRPDANYRRTKAEGERIVQGYIARGELNVTIARLTSVYGPGSTKWVDFCNAIIGGRITAPGQCDQHLHLTYVDDIIDGLLLCAQHPRAVGKCYAIGADPIPSLRQIFDAIADAMGKTYRLRSVPGRPLRWTSTVLGGLLRPLGYRAGIT